MKTGRIGWVAIAAFLSGAVLLAQGLPTASLTGKVTTEGGVALPGATVRVESPRLQGSRDTTTGSNGDYIFNLLPPGDYTVRFELDRKSTRLNSSHDDISYAVLTVVQTCALPI